MVAPSNLAEFTELMTLTGLKYEVFINNVQRLIDTENPKSRASTKDGSLALNEYHTLEEIYSHLEDLAKKYDVVEIVDAGKTTEGRVIKGVKISYKEGNPGIFIEAGIHAREWITPATALYLIDQLLNSKEKNIRALAEKHEWYIFPSFNPDGYVYTHTKVCVFLYDIIFLKIFFGKRHFWKRFYRNHFQERFIQKAKDRVYNLQYLFQ